jgi:hypothetical protein
VDVPVIIHTIHDAALSEWLRSSLKAMPIVEAIHVMTGALVFGTIAVVDLRLLGWAGMHRAYSRIHGELLTWTWAAFGVSVVTGVLLFVVNSVTYYGNTAFRLKMLAILLAGVNMALFEMGVGRDTASWDKGAVPERARLAGALSLTIWIGVIFLARWIGFTKGYDFSIPENVDLNFGQ